MEFKKLTIEKKTWGEGELRGSISFSSKSGSVDLNLTDEHINRLFEVVADTMIETAKEAAQELTCNIIEHKKALSDEI